MLDGAVVSCDGIVTVPVKFQDTYIMGDFYVVDKASHGILGFDILSRLNANIDGAVVSCDGIVTVPVKFQDTYIMGDFYVVDKASDEILGFDILSRLNANIDIQNCQVIVQNNVSEYMKQETPEESKSKIATVCQTCKNHSGAIWK